MGAFRECKSMSRRVILLLLGAAWAPPLIAQTAAAPMMLPAPLEKELSAKASDVTEVTLGKNMLDFAAKFMDGSDKDQAAVRQLIQGLDGIYVRSYEFDKEGAYSMDQVEKLRHAFETPEWQPIVRTRERKGSEATDVLVKQVNGETRGMFILATEPRELTIVMILGPIRMDQLAQLKDLGGLGAVLGPTGPLSGVQHTPRGNPVPDQKGGNQ